MARYGSFKPDRAGIAALFKGAGMQSALARAGKRVEAAANASASAAASSLPTKWRKIVEKYDTGPQPYTADVKVLSNTAVGVVRASGLLGCVDENQNHTLEGSL